MNSVIDATQVKESRAMVILLMAMTLLAVFPLDVVLPSFPALSDHFRTTPVDIALSVSLFAIGLAFSLLLIGPLSDRFGRKKLLLGGIALAALGATGCLLVSDYAWFLFFRVIQAMGCGSFALSQALVQDLFFGRELERLRIWMATAGGIFISSSPLIGTWLQLHVGWQGSFYVFIGLAIIVWLRSCFLLKESRSSVPSPRRIFGAYWLLLGDIRFTGYWLISGLAFACHFSFIVISPLLFMEHLKLSAYQFAWALLLYGVAYVVGGIIASLLHRHMEGDRQINIGLGLIALSGLVMPWLVWQFGLSAATVLIPMLICTAGTTICRPIANSRAMSLYPQYAGTATSAGSLLIFMCGGLISAVINLASAYLTTALAVCFLILSAVGIGLNALISRR
ncbi:MULTISPECIES: MFS transporter [Pseudomonas]|jgi:predicted MFS family arabinose efflux permease|uniref:MFS transporter n=1 Tax=Pseudomonas TaxID=286 RepID=UPI00067E6991|nr:MFS transporter [Pseudomonas mucoides]CRL50008.1 Inner membrane transport protein YdhC [Pseudomonas sp. URMO17WK12:I11]